MMKEVSLIFFCTLSYLMQSDIYTFSRDVFTQAVAETPAAQAVHLTMPAPESSAAASNGMMKEVSLIFFCAESYLMKSELQMIVCN